MICRICSSADVIKLGEVEYYSNFAREIFECLDCRCRFTTHDDGVYEYLHSKAGSRYGGYRDMQEQCKQMFQNRNLDGLKEVLSRSSKYSFIIQAIERVPKTARLLEIGCARGHLTSYFVLAGYEITGMDVSPQAVNDAKEAFGDFFAKDLSTVEAGSPYDIIYHTGMIGCVASPMELTRRLLTLLKPGGRLLFNAPNADSCWLPGQLWIDYAPPPDLVTLFRPGFWERFFCDSAEVSENIEVLPADGSYAIGLKKLFRRKWCPPIPQPLEGSMNGTKCTRSTIGLGTKLWNLFESSAVKFGRLTRTLRFAPNQPSPFGLFVIMTKK